MFATARKVEAMTGLSELGIELLALDVTSIESVRAARDHVREATGGTLDILLNNAGVPYASPAVEIDIEEAAKAYDVNVLGIMRMNNEFIDLLIVSLLHISSPVSYRGVPSRSIRRRGESPRDLSFILHMIS